MRAIFLDIETTGLDPIRHRAIDIAFKIFDIANGEQKATFQSVVKLSPEMWANRDPASIEITGFTWEKISGGREATDIAQAIISLFTSLDIKRGNAVFICQNPAFDRGFFNQIIDVYTQERLCWPYHWLDLASMYWAILFQKTVQQGNPFPVELNLSKNEIANAYHLPPELLPHEAMKGVEHLIFCYESVLGTKFREQLC